MPQFVWRRDPTQVFQTAGVAAAGTAVYTLPTDTAANIDMIWRVKAVVFLTGAVGAHLANGSALLAECVAINKNGVVTFNPAIATSLNPVNSNSAGFALTSRPVTSEAGIVSTAVWTIAANVLTLTITNNFAGAMDISCILDVDRTGSQ